ncbi:MAG: peptide chain release factor N(5)-glutamine methyltransferase [Acidobacteria bacterium]|nr:MAG: peptide chain release factor N(5)-glutamine methyltransferase [Acidobacteriota bacterium]
MQLREALQAGLKRLLEHDVPSSSLAAELLLMHVLQQDRSFLYMHADQDLRPEQLEGYMKLVGERCTGKPTQYVTGHQEFWGQDFEVTPAVLIPRPETEHVIEAVLDLISRKGLSKEGPLRIVDVGTGSGCIPIALARELPFAELYATDISADALDVASRNARRLGAAGQVKFLESDLLSCLIKPEFLSTFDFVVSNPPYVGHDELADVQREVREFEPRLAWGDLAQGEEIYARLFPQAHHLLKFGGSVVVEIGYNKKDAVLRLLGEGWLQREVRQDLAGIPRVVTARKTG